MDYKEKSIIQMAKGAIEERIDYEMSKIITNIQDESTTPTSPRELTVKIKLTPDASRKTINVSAYASSKLAPTTPIMTALYLGKDKNGVVGAVEMTPQIPGQTYADGSEQEGPYQLKIIKMA